MVEAVVSFALKKLDEFGSYLIQEAESFRQVRNEVASLKKDLEWMQSCLKDAQERQHTTNLIQQWVSDVRDIAYKTQNVLDEFLIKVQGGEESPNTARVDDVKLGFVASIMKCSCMASGHNKKGKEKLGFVASIMKCSCMASSISRKGKEVVNTYRISKDIEELKNEMNALYLRGVKFGFQNMNTEVRPNTPHISKHLRRVTSFTVEKDVVGFEDVVAELTPKLVDNQDLRRFLISIVGMGGLGKTTLAGKVYHNDFIKSQFDHCAWVTVSQDYQIRDILLQAIESFKFKTTTQELKDTQKMSTEHLERYLHSSLLDHSYLVVIDDIWEKEAWAILRRAFPDNNKRSRVIITTRDTNVAEHSDERTHVHTLRFLSDDESWQLFYKKAFLNSISNADERLEKLGREMLQKCRGLPLAIIVLGGLLSRKKKHQEWIDVRNNFWGHLRNSNEISSVLALSFNDLPDQLRPCFLYLGLFPEDYVINVEGLIRLFVAEGFAQQDHENKIMEEVAHDYLEDLIKRSLIQIGRTCAGRIVTCKVHDLLRDLAIQKAREMDFIHICDEGKITTPSSIKSSCQREVVYSGTKECRWLQQCNTLSHSLFFFKSDLTEVTTLELERFKSLRVLKFEDCEFSSTTMPKRIGKLILLKYMELCSEGFTEFGETIGNFRGLQTLHIRGNYWADLPTEVSKLHELRHLIMEFLMGPLVIDNLTKLQTLKNVDYRLWIKVNTDKLVNLRELRITENSDLFVEGTFTFDSISKLQSLQVLSVELCRASFASLQPLSRCQYLRDLTLIGKLERLPANMEMLFPYLECLCLKYSRLIQDPMPTLEKLPNLMILNLRRDSYSGKKMICSAKGFQYLEILQISITRQSRTKMEVRHGVRFELAEWQIEDGAMPKLRGLQIPEAYRLTIPERFRSIPPPEEWEYPDFDSGY